MRSYRYFFILCFTLIILLYPAACSAASVPENFSPGLYEIASFTDAELVLDIPTCTVTSHSGENVQLYPSLDVNQQKFYIEALSRGRFRISSLLSGEALAAKASDDSGGTAGEVRLEPVDHETETSARNPQAWILEEAPGGFYYIRSTSGMYLTADSISAYRGASVSLQPFTGDRSQRWRLHRTWSSPSGPVDTDLINPYLPDGAYRNMRLVLTFGEDREVLTASDFSAWMKETDDHHLLLDREAITEYVTQLAGKYDTQGQPRRFTTSYGNTITLYEGNFGWKLDIGETVSLILSEAENGSNLTTEPVWSHRGGSFSSENDIGDSYVEVDLGNQKVWLYQDGEQILETDCVSGTYGTERQTPGGVYSIYYRQSPTVLEGPGYSSPVQYWMAFNGGIGLHDASWRDTFGGDIYLTNGSHGCINLPTDAAAKIYEVAQIGYPVVCYN